MRRALLEEQLLWAYRAGAVRVVARVADPDGPAATRLRAAGFAPVDGSDAGTFDLELEADR